MEEYLKAFYEYQNNLFWGKDIDSIDERIKLWLDSNECKAFNITNPNKQ